MRNALPRAITKLSSSRLRQVPPHPSSYPTGRFPSTPRTYAPGRAKGERRGRRHLVVPKSRAERTSQEPKVPAEAAARRGALLGSQHQRAPETAGVLERPRGWGCVVILSIEPMNEHSPYNPSPNANYTPPPELRMSSRASLLFRLLALFILTNFSLPTSLKLVSRQPAF